MNFMIGNGLTIHYTLEGTGEGIPLVFINALGTDLRIWDGVVPHLIDHYPVLRFDKRGHGLSDCPPAPYSIHDFSTDLLGLLDQLEISKAIVVGISVGGMVAMDLPAGCRSWCILWFCATRHPLLEQPICGTIASINCGSTVWNF
jgi:3-oxoadipate enol-lactonase